MGQQCLIHLLQSDLKCSNLDTIAWGIKIIDNWVSDEKGKKVTLSKNNFAENVLNQSDEFTNIDFTGFIPLFQRIQLIINEFDGEKN